MELAAAVAFSRLAGSTPHILEKWMISFFFSAALPVPHEPGS